MPINASAAGFVEWLPIEGERVSGAQGSAPNSRQPEPDPGWLPL